MKVGDYVRTKDYNGFPGGIAKIKKIQNDKKHKMVWLTVDKALDNISFLELSTNVVKSSPNIIDLIEVGDYVNGFEVLRVDKECDLYPKTLKCQYPNNTDYFDVFNDDIKSIVTREQFSHIEYKVGE